MTSFKKKQKWTSSGSLPMSNKTRPSMKNELARVHTSSSSQNSQFFIILKQSMKNMTPRKEVHDKNGVA
jgi:hypothetical protein